MYSIREFGNMIRDSTRFNAYATAISRAVRPGSVVVEIGCGPAVFAVLACRAGARRVYAIDTEDIVVVARQIAEANGFLDRIEFSENDSQKTALPERADVVISDIRGVLPITSTAIACLQDARERFLVPGGVMIPGRDIVKCAIVQAHQFYTGLTSPWCTSVEGVDLSAPRHMVLNSAHMCRSNFDDMMSGAAELCVLDYMGTPPTNVAAKLIFRANRNGTAHGISTWFETELFDDIGFSSGPGSAVGIYGQLFLPWPEPLLLSEGQEVFVELRANLIGTDYVWQWKTRTSPGPDGCGISFHQSTFEGTNVTSQTLRRRAPNHMPILTEEGESDRFFLQEMNGNSTLDEIATKAAARFPTLYPQREDAFQRAAELAQKLSR